jgi:2-dehydropantoate 2-reductase
LKQAGYDITLVCKYPEMAEKIGEEGLYLYGMGRNLRIKIPAVAAPEEINGAMDIIFLATKAMDMAAAARSCLPLIKPSSIVVSMQNGIMEEELATIVGGDRTVGCVVGFGATMREHGVVELTSRGEMWLGYLDKDPDPPLQSIAEILGNVSKTLVVPRILPLLYAKLIINSCTSTLGAISGLALGPLLRRKRARELFMAVGHEALSVADAMNLDIPNYNGKIRFRKILGYPVPIQHLVIRMIGFKYRRLQSTNLQSLKRGGHTEIDYLNGYIVNKGGSVGINTPVNKKLMAMVREIEEKERPITPENLNFVI